MRQPNIFRFQHTFAMRGVGGKIYNVLSHKLTTHHIINPPPPPSKQAWIQVFKENVSGIFKVSNVGLCCIKILMKVSFCLFLVQTQS